MAHTYPEESLERASIETRYQAHQSIFQRRVETGGQTARQSLPARRNLISLKPNNSPLPSQNTARMSIMGPTPLARLSDQYRRYAALVADTNAARLCAFALGATNASKTITGQKTSRSNGGGWSQARYYELLINANIEAFHPEGEAVGAVIATQAPDDELDSSTRRVLMADALVTRARQTGASVTFVEDAALLALVGGGGLMLRYR
ncbi:MAG: hypothetical protein ABI882_10505 [Acidobacteriota bacterium]